MTSGDGGSWLYDVTVYPKNLTGDPTLDKTLRESKDDTGKHNGSASITDGYAAAGTSGFEDQDNMIYFTESDIYDAILDIRQVESLMFHKGWELDANGKPTIQTFYYIPLHDN